MMSIYQLEFVDPSVMKELIVPKSFRPTLGIGSLYKSGDQSVIEAYRNEHFAREICYRKRCGLIRSPFTFQPGETHGIKRERRLKAYEMPHISQVDYERRKEIDDFYEAFQCHRDQYRDRFDVLHPLVYFKMEEQPCQDPPSIMSMYKNFPMKYYGYRRPTFDNYDSNTRLEPSSMTPS